MSQSTSNLLKSLPSVNAVLEHPGVRPLLSEQGRGRVIEWVRAALEGTRVQLAQRKANGDRIALLEEVADHVIRQAQAVEGTRIGQVINATGVILHTGLGRAPLSQAARAALIDMAGAGNVEIDLDSNRRSYRGHQLQDAWQTLTGCEDSLVVNNNAAATLLTLQALCSGREVVISRGELIEIGGSFRLPEIFELAGVRLREVGTTNRTRLSDYERAIGPETAALMLVHPSNYRVVGFSAAAEIDEIASLAHAHNLLAIHDIGSGSLLDLTKYGLPLEPTFRESLAGGADVALGSGDKLLGGPQAGIMLGSPDCIGAIRRHPLARTVRVDKLALAALSATLDSYLRGVAEEEIPTIALLAANVETLRARAEAIRSTLADCRQLTTSVRNETAPVGGGSLPAAELPTAVVSLAHAELSCEDLARRLRLGRIRVVCRIQRDEVLIDLRSVLPEDDSKVSLAVRLAAESDG